jgi:hypothetical protein
LGTYVEVLEEAHAHRTSTDHKNRSLANKDRNNIGLLVDLNDIKSSKTKYFYKKFN